MLLKSRFRVLLRFLKGRKVKKKLRSTNIPGGEKPYKKVFVNIVR